MTLLRERHLAPWLLLAAGMAVLLALVLTPRVALAQPPEPHRFMEEYNGPATCQTCHGDVTEDVIHSVHYSWENKMGHYSPIAGSIADINWLGMLNEQLGIPGGCGRCHVGSGALPKTPDEVTPEDRAGIDCLICHSPIYDTSLRFPVETAAGEWTLTQDRTLLAARQAQRPTTENCLFCHLNSGGAPLQKRGVDFAPVGDTHGGVDHGDVHADAGMSCVDCHGAGDHKVYGYSPDLWSRDVPEPRLLCDTCHTSAPHTDPMLNQHVRLDCRTCHVTTTGGLMERDWTAEPNFDPVNELYSPVDVVVGTGAAMPLVQWYNGAPAVEGQPWPGSRSDLTARLQPFKLFGGVVPADSESGQPIPLKLEPFYSLGDLETAVAMGASESGMDYSGSWQPKDISALLQVSHGVVGKEDALTCQECHVPDGVVDFSTLGYTPDEVAFLSTISSDAAGVRQPLQVDVVIPPSQPLPEPVNLSGGVDAAKGLGVRVPWSPLLALLFVIACVVVALLWLRRQKPKDAPDQQA